MPEPSTPDNQIVPQELLVAIFKYLDTADLARVALVCKQWHEAASENSLWYKPYLKTLQEIKKDVTDDSLKNVRKFAASDGCQDIDSYKREEKGLDDLVSDIKSKFASIPDDDHPPASNINYKEALFKSKSLQDKFSKKYQAPAPVSNNVQQHSSFFKKGIEKIEEQRQTEARRYWLLIPIFVSIFSMFTLSGAKLEINEDTGEKSESLSANFMTTFLITFFMCYFFIIREKHLRNESRTLLKDLAEIANIQDGNLQMHQTGINKKGV